MIFSPPCLTNYSKMDRIIKSPGLHHIAEKIFMELDSELYDLSCTGQTEKCRKVDANWCSIIENRINRVLRVLKENIYMAHKASHCQLTTEKIHKQWLVGVDQSKLSSFKNMASFALKN